MTNVFICKQFFFFNTSETKHFIQIIALTYFGTLQFILHHNYLLSPLSLPLYFIKISSENAFNTPECPASLKRARTLFLRTTAKITKAELFSYQINGYHCKKSIHFVLQKSWSILI